MKNDIILQTLKQHQHELHHEFAVRSLALFGSHVRNQATSRSDVDLLVEFDKPIGYFHLFRLQAYLEKLLGVSRIDLVVREAVIQELQPEIYGEAVNAFP